jgi:hypothetical protein
MKSGTIEGGHSLGLAILSIITVFVMWFAWASFRPDHYLNPISRALNEYWLACGGYECGGVLDDSILRRGMPRDEVSARMAGAGFSRQGNDTWRLVSNRITEVNWFCSIDFIVHASFDEGNALMRATASVHGPQCL